MSSPVSIWAYIRDPLAALGDGYFVGMLYEEPVFYDADADAVEDIDITAVTFRLVEEETAENPGGFILKATIINLQKIKSSLDHHILAKDGGEMKLTPSRLSLVGAFLQHSTS